VLDKTWDLMFPKAISTMLKRRNKTIIKALHGVDGVISVSEYIKTELIQRGVVGKKIETIYNLPPTFKDAEKAMILQKNGSTIHLFALGLLASFKGFSVLIKAMKQVVESYPNVLLTIAGDGPQKKALEKLTRDLRLEPYVKFAGKVPFASLSQYYANCDMVIFPSIYAEPFGRVALEAMYFGKPIIASRVGGIPEVVEDKKSGLLVSPDNPQELAEAITALASDSTLREDMGRLGKSIVQVTFDAEKIVQKNLDVYTSIK
jgi:glycosyltransferase involved in cell wall biosynthesis